MCRPVTLTPLDREVDPREILREIELAQAFWIGRGEKVPLDSLIIAGLCRRLILAEQQLTMLRSTNQFSAHRTCDPRTAVAPCR